MSWLSLIVDVTVPLIIVGWPVWLLLRARRVRRQYRERFQAFERECVEILDEARRNG